MEKPTTEEVLAKVPSCLLAECCPLGPKPHGYRCAAVFVESGMAGCAIVAGAATLQQLGQRRIIPAPPGLELSN